MIPDKIYIGNVTLSSNGLGERFLLSEWHEKPNPRVMNEEYIRKEALLEWLNERYKSTISNVGCYTGHSVWAEVIEHINEM